MSNRSYIQIALSTALLMAGCVCCKDPLPNPCETCIEPGCDPCISMVAQIEYPDVERCEVAETLASGPPRQMSDGVPTEFWDLTLDEAIRTALSNSRILKDLGGRVLASPQSVQSIYDPSIRMSQPRVGEEAALAAFDAQYQSSFIGTDANQAFNNITLGGGGTIVDSDGFSWTQQLSKTAATGTQFSVARQLRYENSDAPFNLFPSTYLGTLQATIRQPLLQGGGIAFNRIAGPTSQVDLGITRGVVLARIDGDISIAQFERGVRDFVRDVETAYWQLYFNYRSLDALRVGRDSTLTTWKNVRARYDSDLRGGEADQEAQAREQLYLFEERLLIGLNGSLRGSAGLYQTERTLRRMMGLPVSGDRLLRPLDEPIDTPVIYDWHDCLADAMVRRVELREQMWRVKQRELELVAAKNFLLPRLDAIASYRLDGLGDNFTGTGGNFDSLTQELFSFEYYQAQAGLQFSMPLGFRRELAGVRHSKLNLCRERAVLQDQEHLISHDLGEAYVAVETAYQSIQLTFERLNAAEQVVAARTALFDAGKVSIDLLLESQRRLADAQTNYFQARTDHAIAIRNLHFEKGTLLPFNGVRLQEGPWPSQACEQAWYERRRWMSNQHGDRETIPCPVSLGAFSTQIADIGTNDSPTVAGHSDAEQIAVEPSMELDFERLPKCEWAEREFKLAIPADSVDDIPLDLSKPATAEPSAFESNEPIHERAPEETASIELTRWDDREIPPLTATPGPGQDDPANPGPAEFKPAIKAEAYLAHEVAPRNDAAVKAVNYLRQLMDERDWDEVRVATP